MPHLKQTEENKSGIYKAKGGICFDLDVNQFTQVNHHDDIKTAAYNLNKNIMARKNKKVNTKE